MPLGPYTRQTLESDIRNRVSALIAALNELDSIQARAAAENAAGTFDLPGWYSTVTENDPAGTNARDKANLLGTLDDVHSLAAYVFGRATTTPPENPLRYAVFFL